MPPGAQLLSPLRLALQLYREEARYLERTAPWVACTGIDIIKKRIVEDQENRRRLHERFLYAQRFVQIDPWGERAERNVEAHEFAPLAEVG
jgi:nitrite reductase (NADH) large subunit